MRKPVVLAILLPLLMTLPGCPGRREAGPAGRVRIVSSIFVLFDFARTIGAEHVASGMFLPPGAEPHTYEPTARDIMALRSARLFLYTGGLMEPWAERALASADGSGLLAVDVTRGLDLLTAAEEHGDQDEDETPGDHGPVDPHFWLDPVRAARAAETIAGALVKADPAHAADYRARGDALRRDLLSLDGEIRAALAPRAGSVIVFGGHNTFGYFGARYGLTFVSPYPGFSAAAEPQARKLVELAAMMKREKLSVIYHGEGLDPRTAAALASSVNGRLALLHGAHNVSREELAAGVTYFSIMRDNLATLKADPGLFP